MRPKPRRAVQLYGDALYGGAPPATSIIRWPRAGTLARYGLTLAVFGEMYRIQEGCCAICATEPEHPADLVVDHNHKTRQVRGLLCQACNAGLGMFRDSPDFIEAALEYLEQRGCYGQDSLSEDSA